MNHHDFATGICSCGITKAAYDADQTISGECRFGPPGGVITAQTFIDTSGNFECLVAAPDVGAIIRDTILPNLAPAERLNLIEDLLCLVCGDCGELLPPGKGACKCLMQIAWHGPAAPKSIPARLIR